MTTIPNKPQFFKPLIPGFEDELLIPVSFFKYLKGEECEKARLRSQGGKLWPVKINGRRFEDGWREFVEDHDLKIGDFLVFRHEGDLVFDVMVFDRSTCEREYLPFVKEEEFEIREQIRPVYTSTGKKLEKKKKVKTRLEAKASSSVPENPTCVIKLTPDSIKKSKLHIPLDFARECGLRYRSCSMVLKDEEEKCWPAKLLYRSVDGKFLIGARWGAILYAQKLMPGDSLIIELIKNGETPVMKISRLQEHLYANANTKDPELRNSQLETPEVAKESGSRKSKKYDQPETASETKASSSSVTQKSFFVAKVTPYSYKKSKLYVPVKFARLHFENRKCCKVILLDQEGRSWPAYTSHKSLVDEAYIADGWKEFGVANNIKPGDSFIFEFIENGERPILKMCGFKANNKAGETQEAASSSMEKPYVCVTLNVSHIKNSYMKIPTTFSKRCGLAANKCSAVTLTNETGNSWLVFLRVDKHNEAYMTHGWIEFVRENGIEEGDVFKLELVKEGITPELKYYALKQEMGSKNQKGTREEFEDVKPVI